MSFNHHKGDRRRLGVAHHLTFYWISLGLVFLLGRVTTVAAQPSPLEVEMTDTPPTKTEAQALKAKIAHLNQQAQISLENNGSDRAFKLWYQALSLLQQLQTPVAEVQQLGQVGGVAWQLNRTEDLNIITARLKAIESGSEQISIDLLVALNQAYLQVQNIDHALEVCQQILAHAQSDGDKLAQTAALKEIGRLHLSRFNYDAAATIYEELLAISSSQSDRITYLTTLKDIYERSLNLERAIAVKQELFQYYQKNERVQLLPALKLAIASDYEALDRWESANIEYQAAFELAWSQQQLAIAAEALARLGSLYDQHDQNDYALQVYSELVDLQQRTYDYYGLMSTYDRMAQIHQEQQNYPQALYMLQQALEIAESLDYRQQYFADQIRRLQS